MAREKEMWKAVTEEHGELSVRESFVTLTAMEWADKTMLDRACEWLKENIDLYTYESSNTHYPEIKLTECFEEAFRQAMKGE